MKFSNFPFEHFELRLNICIFTYSTPPLESSMRNGSSSTCYKSFVCEVKRYQKFLTLATFSLSLFLIYCKIKTIMKKNYYSR